MNVETIREYCVRKPFVTEEFPFDEVTLVFKVAGKMFALIPLDNPECSISLKCDPEKAIELREDYPSIVPAYHMSKKHWNSLLINEGLPETLVHELIDHSYQLVFGGLPLRTQRELKQKMDDGLSL